MADPFWTLLAPIVAPATLILADGNGPRPAKPYATLDVTEAGAAPWLVEGPPDANGVAAFTEHATANVEVQFYGEGAQGRAKALGQRLRLPTAVDRAAALGIGIGTVRPATSLSALLNETQREERSVVEFTAHVTDAVAEAVGLIEHAEVEQTDAVGATVCRHTIDAPPPAAP